MLQNLRERDLAMSKNSLRMGEYGALELFVEQSRMADGIINPVLRDRVFRSIPLPMPRTSRNSTPSPLPT